MENTPSNATRNWIIGGIILLIIIIVVVVRQSGASNTNGTYQVSPSVSNSISTGAITSPVASSAPSTATKGGSSKVITPNIPVTRTDGVSTSVPKVFTVVYTSSGFSPLSMKIQRGQTVHFVNQTNKSLRLVSTNQTFNPGFLQDQSVGAGGTYDYVFTVPGNWTYQNYDNTKFTGTIIVE